MGIKKKFSELSKSLKIQSVLAFALTVICLVSLPVLAWFSQRRDIMVASEINAPINLFITATHKSSSSRIELGDIDILEEDENGNVYHKDYVFCVRNVNPDADNYILQLAFTTNIPFTYKIFRADYLNDNENINLPPEIFDVEYINENATGSFYYRKADEIQLSPINEKIKDSDIIAKDRNDSGNIVEKSYDDYNNIQQNAIPLYYQSDEEIINDSTSINYFADEENGQISHYYILEVSWTPEQVRDRKIQNNKETDIIYITAGNKES